ncbi:MAG TPA: sialidase family protein [Opitutaceae bacterium]
MRRDPSDRTAGACGLLQLPTRRRILLIVAILAGALVATRNATRESFAAPEFIPAFRAVDRAGAPDTAPYFARAWITPEGHAASVHSSTICLLPSGDLFAAWYGGTREGAADVALFASRLTPGKNTGAWGRPAKIVDRELAESELDRRIKKVGNAVVFADRAGTLWMIYVSVSLGGWSGSALNIKTSRDEGLTWSESQRLTLNPFLNISTLVRNKPIHANDGRIGVPVYHEFAQKFPQMLWLTPDADGRVEDYQIRNLATEVGLIQPTLVPLGGDRVLMMLRDGSATRRLRTAYSDDNGWTWSATATSELPNPDSAVDALRLRDGRIVLAYNHAENGRGNLRLAVSADDGRSWQAGPVIEAAGDGEFSYPQLAADRRSRIHLIYTWKRERIRHVEFNAAWLDRGGATTASVALNP